MDRLRSGLEIQGKVIKALMLRELVTRFGRENIGFLWMMAEPMLFAGLVGLLWTFIKGPEEHGIGIVAFVVSGYIPLTFLRNTFSRCVSVFIANGSLMYHRQVKLIDLVFVRVLIEFIGTTMAWLFMGTVLSAVGLFPVPHDIGVALLGWGLYFLFVLSVAFIIAPLSEMSEILEKLLPVTVYLAIPFSGTFNLASWLTPAARDVALWSPMVNAMEMIRYGVFGNAVRPYYSVAVPLTISAICLIVGLALCSHVRKTMVVE
ncbi:ABC transporter permease (plasmid) [Sphingobium sp. V4]|uniref:ABC transporter permease n=1 Tax=Sphingobium sp. V4 TaxID=3038927 RepID=UPI00255802B0|nr:ABC transporter permease [Sphingobium sp. V4]WIW91121.1 ABC transporter permease [Sphingobium sp. V4]